MRHLTTLGLFLIPSTMLVAQNPPTAAELATLRSKAIAAYERASETALKRLTGYVHMTVRGKDDISEKWRAECDQPLKLLDAMHKPVNLLRPDDEPWRQVELKSWRNAETIGEELILLHYEMASTRVEIEQDIRDSEALIKDLHARADVVNRLSEKLGSIAAHTNELAPAEQLESAGTVFEAIDQMNTHARTVGAMIGRFKGRKFKFIEKRDLEDSYRKNLDKLAGKAIDVDETGGMAAAEREWERVMYDTYQRYLISVEKWKELHKVFTKEQKLKLLEWLLNKGVAQGFTLCGVPVPGVGSADAEKLGDHCLKLKNAAIKIFDRATNNAWKHYKFEEDKLEDLQLDLDEADRNKRTEIEEFANGEAGTARETFDELRKDIEEGRKQVARDLRLAEGDLEQQRRLKQVDAKLVQDLYEARQKRDREVAYWLHDWKEKELGKQQRLYDEEHRKIEAARDKLKEQKPK